MSIEVPDLSLIHVGDSKKVASPSVSGSERRSNGAREAWLTLDLSAYFKLTTFVSRLKLSLMVFKEFTP